MTRVKLCGLKRLCDIDWANEFRPDYVGFVFAGKKRRVTDEQAAALRSHLLSDIPAVGVFVDEPQEHILRLLEAGTIQVVQLHGSEDEAYIKALRQQTKAPLIKAFSLESEADTKAANASSVTYVLVDHGSGGSGQAFDWDLLRFLERPYFLAGGLSPENIKQALAYRPFAVDVSSGIETNGYKDYDKIKRFMACLRGAMVEEEQR